jgi:ABC-type phosphate transport system substrate-binding protein
LTKKTILSLALLLASGGAGAQEAAYKVIVNAANPTLTAKRDVIAQLFMSRKVTWAHGPAGDPVDQSMTSPIRDAFSREILGMALPAVQNYWRKRMFETREFPPLVKGGDTDVIGYVAKSPGGVGYIGASTELPPSVKALKIIDAIH